MPTFYPVLKQTNKKQQEAQNNVFRG